MIDVSLQLDLALRLVIAAALGGAVGVEREIHGHPAGIRTHMLVSLGAALFTVMSIHGITGDGAAPDSTDASRIAAQIVSGIGFLGAGAILKDGVVVRGLTTAASLWATSAVGMATGAGEYAIAIVGGAIILTSLWPINALTDRIRGTRLPELQIRLALEHIDALGSVSGVLTGAKLDIASLQTQRLGKNSYQVDIAVRGRSAATITGALDTIARMPGVDIVSTTQPD